MYQNNILGLAGKLKPELEIHAFCKVSLIPGGKPQSSVVKRGRDVAFNQVRSLFNSNDNTDNDKISILMMIQI